MAYPPSRSMNSDLYEGMTDGKYKKIITNRGGVVDPLTYESREALNDIWFGIHETPDKVLPDGTRCTTTDYVGNRKSDPNY